MHQRPYLRRRVLKNSSGTLYAAAMSSSSTKSTRRSPSSHFETHVWETPRVLVPLRLIVSDQGNGVIRHKTAYRTAGLDEHDDGSIWSQDEP